ncbi:MAG TPA: MlaD family protein [Kofleriaceae bacterium]|nr:MlaD family protein [Kofleriaceae bacterium]
MMATTTHFKLGLLALIVLAALVASVLGLGLRKRPQDPYYTYFDESVQGLELGAQVKYRGVQLGSVGGIAIAPDHKHVQVKLAIDRERGRSVELASVAPQLRTQLVMVGITGLKVVELDLADPGETAEALPFRPAQPYIASRPSLLTTLQDQLQTTGDHVELLVDHVLATVDKLELVIDELHREAIPRRIAAIVGNADGAVADLRQVMRRLDRAEVPDKLAAAIDRFSRAATQVNQILSRVDGEHGLVASARKATESIGQLGHSTLESTGDLDQTLREFRDAARAVREFMEQLEREPDMLVKGRARTNQP